MSEIAIQQLMMGWDGSWTEWEMKLFLKISLKHRSAEKSQKVGIFMFGIFTIFGFHDFYVRDCFIWEEFVAPLQSEIRWKRMSKRSSVATKLVDLQNTAGTHAATWWQKLAADIPSLFSRQKIIEINLIIMIWMLFSLTPKWYI
jgi:hypothetical protein